MKKLIALMLGLVMMFTLSAVAFAAGEQTGSMTLTVVVPKATYTIHIPSDVKLEYGNTEKQEIGEAYVTEVEGFDQVTVKTPYTDLINTSDPTDTIPLVLYGRYKVSGSVYEMQKDGLTTDFTSHYMYNASRAGAYGYDDNGCTTVIYDALVSDWSGATGGATYQAVVTFEFEGK